MYSKMVFSGAACFLGMAAMTAILCVSSVLAEDAADIAANNAYFTEELKCIVNIKENAQIIPPSLRAYPGDGKMAYVYTEEGGFIACMNDGCGPNVDAVAKGTPFASPDRNHWAGIALQEGKSRVMLNGHLGRRYERVAALRFSPDSMKVAYIAQEGDAFFVCVNQDRHPSFYLIDPQQGIVFSNDSMNMAYVALTDKNAWCVVKNGKSGPVWEEIKHLTFSPDGSRMAYAGREKNQWHLVEGDKRGPGHSLILHVAFSPDSKSLAYIARSKDGAFMVLNDKPQGVYDSVPGVPLFSPTGERFAYSVVEKTLTDSRRMRIVLDGKLGKPYDFIGVYLFSADGKQFAYVAHKGDQKMVVHAGAEHDLYDEVGIPVFDPAGLQLAYKVQKDSKWHIIHNGTIGPAFDTVTTPGFSLRGGRMAYLAAEAGLFVVVVDGKVVGRYPWATEPEFSPDGRHYAYVASRGDESGLLESFLVIDGREGTERFLSLLKQTSLVFTGNRTVSGIALKDDEREFWWIRATIGSEEQIDG